MSEKTGYIVAANGTMLKKEQKMVLFCRNFADIDGEMRTYERHWKEIEIRRISYQGGQYMFEVTGRDPRDPEEEQKEWERNLKIPLLDR